MIPQSTISFFSSLTIQWTNVTVAQQFEHPNGGEFTFQVNLVLDLSILVVYMCSFLNAYCTKWQYLRDIMSCVHKSPMTNLSFLNASMTSCRYCHYVQHAPKKLHICIALASVLAQ